MAIKCAAEAPRADEHKGHADGERCAAEAVNQIVWRPMCNSYDGFLTPRCQSVRYVDHVRERGVDLYALACALDLEGVVAKWGRGTYYTDGATTSWLKGQEHGLFAGNRPTRAVRGVARRGARVGVKAASA